MEIMAHREPTWKAWVSCIPSETLSNREELAWLCLRAARRSTFSHCWMQQIKCESFIEMYVAESSPKNRLAYSPGRGIRQRDLSQSPTRTT